MLISDVEKRELKTEGNEENVYQALELKRSGFGFSGHW